MPEEPSNDDENDENRIEINITSNVDGDTSENTDEDTDEDTSENTSESENLTDADKALEDDGTIIVNDGSGTLRLVGTVHVSEDTKDRVINTIREENPDVVAIELDNERLTDLFGRNADETVGDTDSSDKGFQEIIRKAQQKQFDEDGVLKPGEADMLPAVEHGISHNTQIALIDMSVSQLKQNVKDNAVDESGNLDLAIQNKSLDEFINDIKNLISSRSETVKRVKEDGMKSVIKYMEETSLSNVNEQMEPLENIAPEVIEALIDERDKYMAGRLRWLQRNGHNTVAVMGRGHMPGVYNYLQNPQDIPNEYVCEPDWYNYSKVSIN